jgi:hypothetical protein
MFLVIFLLGILTMANQLFAKDSEVQIPKNTELPVKLTM